MYISIKLLFARLMNINVFSEIEPARALKTIRRLTFIFRIIYMGIGIIHPYVYFIRT